MANSNSQESITVRKFPSNFEHVVPNRAVKNNALGSHFMNAMSLLFPDGEQFFIDNVKRFESFADSSLKKRIRSFAGQEGMHGNAHSKWNQNLEKNGYDVSRIQRNLNLFLESFDKYWHLLNPKLGLSVTVALEHITATQSAWFLDHPEILDGFDESLRELSMWHSCEEIEHRSVAFDLLQQVDGSYSLRMVGHLIANFLLYTMMYTGAFDLYRQEKGVNPFKMIQNIDATKDVMQGFMKVGWQSFVSYLHPNFHPDQDSEAMAKAKKVMAEIEAGWAAEKIAAN